MINNRRAATAAAVLMQLIATHAPAQVASPLQDRSVTLVVQFSPGRATDILARLIGVKSQTTIHQSVIFLTVAAIDKQVEPKEIRALAVTGESRVPNLPSVPTFKENGVAGLENSSWFAVLAPARTDAKLMA